MTKKDFIKFWSAFETLLRQEVNEHPAWIAVCELPSENDGSGYYLHLYPQCMLWGSEVALLNALTDSMYISLTFEFDRKVIKVW